MLKGYFISGLLFAFASIGAWGQTIENRSGGGNMNNGLLDASNIQRISILESTGANMVRVNLYPNDYWDFTNNVPRIDYADALVLDLAQRNIRVVLLFEHYEYFPSLGQPLGTYDKWEEIGTAFANRYAPGSSFFTSNGFPSYGIEYFTAINEPDLGPSMPKTILENPENYHDALEGLADGVHSINNSLKVNPGGFASENAAGSHTLNGFGTAIADLFNAGKLYGIDLHTYNDLNYAPILKYDNTNHVEFMAFYDFSQVKNACGITADIKFCATEFGFKENTQGINDELAAKRLLTCIWGNLGTVANDGVSSATDYALIWNIYNTIGDDPIYGMCYSQSPYAPTPKGETFNLVMNLASGMDFVELDPFQNGDYILEGAGKKMWVFQNYPLLSAISGSSYTIDQIPSSAVELHVYDWSGLLYSIPIMNLSSHTFNNLNLNETYMFVAQDALSIPEDNYAQFDLFPNPFSEAINVLSNGEKLQVYDVNWKLLETISDQELHRLIGETYPSGIYFVHFDNGEVRKIVKQ